jgi:hypothetical protein
MAFQLPESIITLNNVLLHKWAGPWIGIDEAAAKLAAENGIPVGVRLKGLEVILLINGVPFKYWYKNGTTSSDLVPFSTTSSTSINSVSSNTTAGSAAGTDYVYLVSGTTTITLPTAVGNTNLYTIKRVGTNTVSIATTSSQTIDGSTSPITINVQNVSLTLVSDGSNWKII